MEPCPENTNVLLLKMCKCGRAPHRQHARNCHFCNADAQKRYRRRMLESNRKLKEIEQLMARKA